MAGKRKYYTVWIGRTPGVYTTWDECKKQTEGHAGAKYKSFPTLEEASLAFESHSPTHYIHYKKEAGAIKNNPPAYRQDTVLPLPMEVQSKAIAVDAACSKNPGPMEYRGIDLRTGAEVFHFGPIRGTNNIGEFLAIVHGLALLEKAGDSQTAIYSDSRNALLWVKKKKCATKLAQTPQTQQALDLVDRATEWLLTHTYSNPLIKWETTKWGEIPADFGRK